MSGKPKKLTADDVRKIRAWWQARRAMPTRRQMCEHFGISNSALHQTACGLIHKAVR